MSKATHERAEAKKEIIRQNIWRLFKECVNLSPEAACATINKHIDAMKYAKPQENHLVNSVVIEIKQSLEEFYKRMMGKAA